MAAIYERLNKIASLVRVKVEMTARDNYYEIGGASQAFWLAASTPETST